jgi:riboflavin kinase/FMN adenylyltransferase
MSHIDFIGMLSSKIDIAKIVVGYDHNFGKNREGDSSALRKMSEQYDFDVIEIQKQTIDGMDVKSSSIRRKINCGEVFVANRLLGYDYSMQCKVWEIGQEMISLQMDNPEKLLPKDGLYLVEIERDKKFLEIKSKKICLIDKKMSFAIKKEDTFVVKFIGEKTELNTTKIET